MRAACTLALAASLAACGSDPEQDKQAQKVRYACEGAVALDVIFNDVSRIATVLGPEPEAILLLPIEVETGFGFANGSYELRGTAEQITWTANGTSRQCQRIAAPPEAAG